MKRHLAIITIACLCALSIFGQGKLMHDGSGAPTGSCNNAIYVDVSTGIHYTCGVDHTWATDSSTVMMAGVSGVGTVFVIPVSNTVLATTTGTVYTSVGNIGTPLSAVTEGIVSFPCPRAGTLRNLYVRTGTTAKVNTPVTVTTLRKNGADTAVTVTLTQTVSTTTSDTTHNASVSAGDLITLSLVTTGTVAVSVSIAGISFELD